MIRGRPGPLGRRLLVAVGVAAAIVVLAAAVPLANPPDLGNETTYAEYDPAAINPDRVPARDERPAAAASGSGVVVIDAAHANRFARADVQPLVEALSRAGLTVRFHDGGDLGGALADADAFVVIDPARPFAEADLNATEDFVDRGGRLLILGEPDRVVIGASAFGATLATAESRLTELGARFDLAFDTRYLYDQVENDGNYQRPLLAPADDAALTDESVSTVAVYTATTVRSTADGTVVLRTAPSARLSGADAQRRYPVAVRDGNVLAVGDASWIHSDRVAVADNEVFLQRVVDFLAGGGNGPAGGTGSTEGPATGNETAG